MKKTHLATLILTATLGLSALHAEPATSGADSARPGLRHKLADIFASVDLSSEQKDQIREIVQQHRSQFEPLVHQLIDARRALRDQIRVVPSDEGAIRARAANLASVESNLAVERSRLFTELRPVITDEQAAKLTELQDLADKHIDDAINKIGNPPGTR